MSFVQTVVLSATLAALPAQPAVATGYAHNSGTTRWSGPPVGGHTIACDERLRMRWYYVHAGAYSGVYQCTDTGAAIRGVARIDVFIPSHDEAMRFGIRGVRMVPLPNIEWRHEP